MCGTMNSKVKLLVIVIVAAAIIIPASIYAYNLYLTTQVGPANFIPSNSTFVLKINQNGSSYYIFGSDKGFAILTPINSGIQMQKSNLTFNNTSIPLTKYANIAGFEVYQITLYNIIDGYLTNQSSRYLSSYPINDQFIQNLTNESLYLYEPYSNHLIVGTLGEIKNTIYAYNHGTNFSNKYKYISSKGLAEFYINSNNETIWGNISNTSIYVFVHLTNGNISQLYNETSYLRDLGVKVIKLNSSTLELIIPVSSISKQF